jgi:hypothetical protein
MLYVKKIPIFDPHGYFKLIWDLIIAFFDIFYLFFIPIHIIYEILLKDLIISDIYTLSPFVFSTNILINLNTGYYF